MLNTLKTIAPISDVINGKMNSTISLNGSLTQDMIPDVKSISGDLMGNILQGSLNKNKSALLTELDNKATFLDLKDINLKDVKAVVSFKNGKVAVKPLDSPRSAPVTAQTLQSLQRPNGFGATP